MQIQMTFKSFLLEYHTVQLDIFNIYFPQVLASSTLLGLMIFWPSKSLDLITPATVKHLVTVCDIMCPDVP